MRLEPVFFFFSIEVENLSLVQHITLSKTKQIKQKQIKQSLASLRWGGRWDFGWIHTSRFLLFLEENSLPKCHLVAHFHSKRAKYGNLVSGPNYDAVVVPLMSTKERPLLELINFGAET